MLGNAILNLVKQRLSIKDYPLAADYIGPDMLNQYEILEKRCSASQAVDPDNKDDDCAKLLGFIRVSSGDLNVYDGREFESERPERFFIEYLNKPDVIKALNLPASITTYSTSSKIVSKNF